MSKDCFSPEDIQRAERLLQAEVKKCELDIETVKKELEELRKPKGFFASSNKKEIKAAEERLLQLERRLIDLQAMTAEEFLSARKAEEKMQGVKKVGSGILNFAGDMILGAGKAIPIPGTGVIGKALGGALKNLGKKIND